MDIQLQELLDKIRREGLEAAEAERARIISEAEANKARIIVGAEKEAASIVEKARSEAAKAEDSGRAALSQASRDFLLAFRGQLEATLSAAVAAETKIAYGPEVIAEAIPLVVKALSGGGADNLEVLVPSALLAKLEARIPAILSAELRKGVVLRPSSELEAGFRIIEKNGAAYYDFSAPALAELFASRLNTRLAETLRSSAKGI